MTDPMDKFKREFAEQIARARGLPSLFIPLIQQDIVIPKDKSYGDLSYNFHDYKRMIEKYLKKHETMKIINTDAYLLTIDEARSLISYANNQPEGLNTWGNTDLQAILDMYHSQNGWDGFSVFLREDPVLAEAIYEDILRDANIRRGYGDDGIWREEDESDLQS